MATCFPPVIQMMRNSFAGEDRGKVMGRPAVLPRAAAGGDVNIAPTKLGEDVGVGKVREVIDWVVEIGVLVVHAVHEVPDVVDTRQAEASADDVGMFEEG